ncbi:MAG: enoyl-CoA hydratase/isomerase family protein [Xanthobacteraceae bacterium]
MNAEPEILHERRGAAGVITLNRPRALNAVTLVMVRELRRLLDQWRDDPAVTRVVVMGAGDRAFSAGGDLRQVYELGQGGRQEEALIYWREEYTLNTIIKQYPKPYVSLLDGIVMGGGVGVSVHGSHRVAGDKFMFAMPEVNIGFFPDVGATWFLPRMPGELGTYCALTGERLRADDAVASGVATHRVASARIAELLEALCGNVSVDAILSTFAAPPVRGPVVSLSDVIGKLFSGDTVEGILADLDRAATSGEAHADWAAVTAKTIRSRSPTSMKIALEQVRRGRSMSFEECMRTEFRIVSRIVYDKDFYEGVRAAIIDKDSAPKWRPASLAEVTAADVERHFAPLEKELQLP